MLQRNLGYCNKKRKTIRLIIIWIKLITMQNFKFETYPDSKNIEVFDREIEKVEKHFRSGNAESIANLLKNNTKQDITSKGVYVFFCEKRKEIEYIGISRTIYFRLQQHTNHKHTSSASLAYLMAKNEYAKKEGWSKTEDWNQKRGFWKELKADFENSKKFRERFQNKIKEYKVTFVEFENSFEMALFEIYASIKFQTHWNSFRTH